MGITQSLCEIIHKTNYGALGPECVARTKQAIMDGLAVGVAGCKERPISILAQHMRKLGGSPQAIVWGLGFRASIVQAAYINAAAAHVLDFEPMWSPPTHAVSATVGAAFSLAESCSASGKQIIAAVANGIEIQGRLQFAGDQYVAEDLVFHPPGYAGVLGATTVAACLLRLDVPHMQQALGLASSRAGSLFANVGSMTKCTHCGNAAASGVDAALLINDGFTATLDVLESPKGLIQAFYPAGFDEAKLLAYGKPFRIVDPGLAIKLFPCHYVSHFGITAALELRPQIPDPSEIVQMRILAAVMKYADRPNPVDGLDGKFSWQYTAAAAILDGVVKIDTFSDQRRFSKDMVTLLSKIVLRQDHAISGELAKMRMEIEVDMRDGRHLKAICHGPKGIWGNLLSPQDHRAKLDDCFAHNLTRNNAVKVIDLLDHLEEQDASGVMKILSLISGD